MLFKTILFGIWFVTSSGVMRAQSFKATNLTPQPGSEPPVLLVSMTGIPTADDLNKYKVSSRWHVSLQRPSDDAMHTVENAPADVRFDVFTQHIELHLPDVGPDIGDGRTVRWQVSFDGFDADSRWGMLPYPALGSDLPQDRRFLRPISGSEKPTISLTGSFVAGGGTKPIYAIKETANVLANRHHEYHGWRPGVTSEVDINQSTSPPAERSRVDPDSISFGGALWNIKGCRCGPLYGVITHLQLADFEFSRQDPSSSYIGGLGSSFILDALRPKGSHTFVTLYPYAGLEAGHNLNKPRQLNGVVIDLKNYSTILRGDLGADAAFNVVKSDWTTAFSVATTYRVRIPAYDEPFVTDYHKVKAAYLTHKARNLIDVAATYTPPHWQYFGFQTEYKYGSEPPIFNLVHHSVTVGITFSAIQPSFGQF